MKLVVGLGNPGKEYVKNRHNAGSIILDKVLQDRGLRWEEHKKFQALINITEDTVYAKPLVYMNNSGVTVSSLANFYKIDPEDITVIHDDVDLGMGRVKKQFGGGTAGHHGVEDIKLALGTLNFNRIRVGVGRPGEKRFDIKDWVLSDFTDEELQELLSKDWKQLIASN